MHFSTAILALALLFAIPGAEAHGSKAHTPALPEDPADDIEAEDLQQYV